MVTPGIDSCIRIVERLLFSIPPHPIIIPMINSYPLGDSLAI
jgi:hypothetical protein